MAEIPEEQIVEAHGTFFTSHCMGCRKVYNLEWMKEEIFADKIPRCTECEAVVKPGMIVLYYCTIVLYGFLVLDIVFFGEALPRKFFTCAMMV